MSSVYRCCSCPRLLVGVPGAQPPRRFVVMALRLDPVASHNPHPLAELVVSDVPQVLRRHRLVRVLRIGLTTAPILTTPNAKRSHRPVGRL